MYKRPLNITKNFNLIYNLPSYPPLPLPGMSTFEKGLVVPKPTMSEWGRKEREPRKSKKGSSKWNVVRIVFVKVSYGWGE